MKNKAYVTKKRVGFFMPVDDDKKLAEKAEEIMKKTGQRRFSKNQLAVMVIQSYLKGDIEI